MYRRLPRVYASPHPPPWASSPPASELKSKQELLRHHPTRSQGSALVFRIMSIAGCSAATFRFSLSCQRASQDGLDGCLRDIAELRRRGYPVFSSGVSVSGLFARDQLLGRMGGTIVCGEGDGRHRRCGESDDDGVVCLPAARLSDILVSRPRIYPRTRPRSWRARHQPSPAGIPARSQLQLVGPALSFLKIR